MYAFLNVYSVNMYYIYRYTHQCLKLGTLNPLVSHKNEAFLVDFGGQFEEAKHCFLGQPPTGNVFEGRLKSCCHGSSSWESWQSGDASRSTQIKMKNMDIISISGDSFLNRFTKVSLVDFLTELIFWQPLSLHSFQTTCQVKRCPVTQQACCSLPR